jgi:uncharacterized lipoprotein NlpE involved in copper resistance
MKKLLIIMLLSCVCWACGNSSTTATDTNFLNTDSSTAASADMAHNSHNSLDYQGSYKGVLPCADCSGMETEIQLSSGDTFVRKTKYLGKNEPNTLEETGTFTWNEAGSIITLGGVQGASQYMVGENTLTQLDLQGNKITGQLADKYVLRK